LNPLDRCPKQMRFGPCGGVRGDTTCEVGDRPCPFVGALLPSPAPRPAVPLPFPTSGRTLVVDVRAPRRWDGDARALWRDTAAVLDGCVALLGEHVDNPALTDDSGALPAAEVIELLATAGVPVLVTVTGRDRDLTAARRLVRHYRDAGASAIHCVTGDHPRAMGIDRPVTFAAEAMTLIGAAVHAGVAVTVGESPASPGGRVGRLEAKAAAGAAACILNHAGAPEALTSFASAVAGSNIDLALFAPVPVVADGAAALALAAFPGLRLPPGYLRAIVDSPRPEEEGLQAASRLARVLLASGCFAGLNLSGGHGADPYERLRTTARYIAAMRDC
jgi:methylenetetrahydrofolate reductase (NADPH)